MTGADNNALLEEIAQLAGAINRHKSKNHGFKPSSYGSSYVAQDSYRGRGRGRGRGGNRGGFRSRGGRYRGNFSQRNPYNYDTSASRLSLPKIDSFCSIYTRTGTCSQGQACRYIHDASRVALCRASLHGECRNPTCTLSHEPNEHNAPLCTHFAQGRCTRDDCKYTHMVNLTRDAPTCRAFALEGWCDAGAKCTKCHIYHCPDFEESGGKCPRPQCPLKHVLRLKKPAQPSEPKAQEEKVSVSSLLQSLTREDGEDEDGTDTYESSSSDEDIEHSSSTAPENSLAVNDDFVSL